MWGLSGRFDFAGLDYDGQFQDGTPYKTDTDDYIINIKGLIGWDLDNGKWYHTLFTGLGYRYWNDDIKGQGGYEREVNWLYWPIGWQVATAMGDTWIFKGNFEFDILAQGKVKSHLEDVGFSSVENTQDFGSGFGFAFALDFIRAPENSLKWSMGLFFNYMHVDKSDIVMIPVSGGAVGVYEPENETAEVGVRFSLLW